MKFPTLLKTDSILLLGMILAPMTGLRIAKVGPAELLVFAWCILNIKKVVQIHISNYNLKFWFVFLFLIIIGGSFGILFYPDQVVFIDIITWIYLSFISLSIYQVFRFKDYSYINTFIKSIVLFGGLWYCFLYLYSLLVNTTFLGAPLWYGNLRFSGGATNPHQIAVFIGAFVPLTLKYIKLSVKKLEKIIFISLFFIYLYLGYETKSSTLQFSIVLSLLFLIFRIVINKLKSQKDKKITFILITLLVLIIYVINNEYIINMFLSWLESDPNGLGRLDLFVSISDTLEKNWLVGLGPGNHAWAGTAEYHNTYLEIIAMSGLLGLANFLIYTVKLFKIIRVDIYFVSSVLALYFYGFAGFAMRRLIYWSIMGIILASAERLIIEKSKA